MENRNLLLRKNSTTQKVIIVALLTLVMLIPVSMLKNMVKERQGNKNAEQTEMGWKWGGRQQLTGPILVIPYTEDPNRTGSIKYAYILPDLFNVKGNIIPEKRTRGVQKVLNYQAIMNVDGEFPFPNTEKLNIHPSQVVWEDCFIMLGIPNLQGIKNKITFNINNKPSEIIPGVPANDIIDSGITAKIRLDPDNKNTLKYNFDLTLNGTEGIYFLPVGKQTSIHMQSTWHAVRYTGNFVATEKTEVKDGIDAKWDIFDYNRNFTQMWTGENKKLQESVLGIDLELPIDHYQKTLRAVKYAIMFIVLTFLVFFMLELLGKKRIHPIQYLLVSSALVLFYSLLLSLSEHIGFDKSYVVSSLAVIALITAYSHSIFKNKKQTIFMGLFLLILYLFLYIVIQMEDMALLLGSIGLFIALATVMYTSRKIDWYKEDSQTQIPHTIENKQ